jgi:hypothetical protein
MKVKNTFLLSGIYMTAYKDLRPHKSYDMAPSILYECEADRWFVTTEPKHNGPGLEEITKEQAENLMKQ